MQSNYHIIWLIGLGRRHLLHASQASEKAINIAVCNVIYHITMHIFM